MKKIAVSIISLGLIATGGFIFLINSDKTVTFCNPNNNCWQLTPKEYKDELKRLTDMTNVGTPLSYDEYQLLVMMYDAEIKKQKGIELNAIDISKNNLTKVNEKIKLLQ